MNRISQIFPSLVPSVLSRPRLRRGLLLLVLPVVLAACSGDDEPAFTRPPQEDLQEVTLYLSLPALSDSAAKRLGDPGTAQEETDGWNTLALFIVYSQPDAAAQEVRCETLTQAEYAALPPSAAGSPYKQYTLNVPAGTVSFYGLTYYSPADGESYPGAAALGEAVEACQTKEAVEALAVSNYYPYDEGTPQQSDASKFCSVASGYYQNEEGKNSYVIDYSTANADPTQIPTLTLRRLAAKIDVQWDAQAAYTDGDLVQPSVEGFQFIGRKEGKVFPELNKIAGTFEEKRWDFYNTTPVSQRFGRVYHYTFPDGSLAPSAAFTVKTNTNPTGQQYTLQWKTEDYLRRATWYKVNATVKGNTTGGTITISGWNDGTSSPGN